MVQLDAIEAAPAVDYGQSVGCSLPRDIPQFFSRQRSYTETSDSSTSSEDSLDTERGSILSSSNGPKIIIHEILASDSSSSDSEESVDNAVSTQMTHLAVQDSANDATSEEVDDSDSSGITPVLYTQETLNEIVRLMEEYFSDESLSQDIFLLKHIRRHRQGFISLKLLAGYKKIRKFTRDWRVVAEGVKKSDQLQLDNTGKKVKRRNQLPQELRKELPLSKNLVAVGIPAEEANMKELSNVFGNYGSVISLQVVRPNSSGSIPELLKPFTDNLPKSINSISAIIEFEKIQGAAVALREFKSTNITLHSVKRMSDLSKPTPVRTLKDSPKAPMSRSSWSPAIRRCQGKQQSSRPSSSDSDEPLSWRRNDSDRPKFMSRSSNVSPHLQRRVIERLSQSAPTSPSMRRHSPSSVDTIRAPRGPDGTKGFNHRQKN